MFIAYKLDLIDMSSMDIDEVGVPFIEEQCLISNLEELGKNYKEDTEKPTADYISRYLTKDGSIDASILEEDWFPELKNKQVFLSHSHDDLNLAKGIAALLQASGISVFIDSMVWNYCDELLRQIDDDYCMNGLGDYNYTLRNYTTSHVHNMLGVALMKMMDQCECVIFLNTKNAIAKSPLECGAIHSEKILSHTHSPWIYHEIQMMKYIQKKIPKRLICETTLEHRTFEVAKSQEKLPYFNYKVNLNDLAELTLEELTALKTDVGDKALNQLYRSCSSKRYIQKHYPDELLKKLSVELQLK